MQIGDKFSHLEIIEIILSNKNTPKSVICKCDCGNPKLIYRAANYVAKYAGVQSCGCAAMAGRTGPKAKLFKGVGDIGMYYYRRLQGNAKNRKINFNISLEFMWDLFLKQDRKCIFTKEPLCFYSLRQNNKGLETTASLDRINNDLGYEENNVQWVHKDINYIRGNKTVEDFVQMCKRVNNYYNLKILPPQPDETIIQQNTEKRHKVPRWAGIGEIGKNAIAEYKRFDKNHREFNLSLEYLWELFQKQEKRCPFTGERLIFGSQGSKIETTASLDRIDSLGNYVEGNVRWIHKEINWAKHDLPDTRFIKLCTKIANY